MKLFTIAKLGNFYALKYKGKIILLIEEKKGKLIIHSLSEDVKFSRRVDE